MKEQFAMSFCRVDEWGNQARRMAVACAVAVFAVAVSAAHASADEDIFADYNAAMQKPAEANATNVYNAWGDNMANMIESGYRDGVVIRGEGEYAGGKVHADGVGNVVVDRHANVGPIVNKPKIENSTVVIKKDPTKPTKY